MINVILVVVSVATIARGTQKCAMCVTEVPSLYTIWISLDNVSASVLQLDRYHRVGLLHLDRYRR
jgi:hypothetical protein